MVCYLKTLVITHAYSSGIIHKGPQSPHPDEGTQCGNADVAFGSASVSVTPTVASGSASVPVTATSSTGEGEVIAIIKRVSCSRQERKIARNRSTFCFEIP